MSKQIAPVQEQPYDANVPIRKLLYFSTAVVLFQAAVGYLIYLTFGKWEDRSNFGDMFGAVGTLFSGLAFAGVIYAILLQRRDLELQRKELELTRDELKRSAEAQEKSEQALVEQARVMELTAKLTAMNFLAEAYRSRIELLREMGRAYQQERNKLDEILHTLEELSYQASQHHLAPLPNTPPNESFDPTPR